MTRAATRVRVHAWHPMITDVDAGGAREFVGGRAVHCGTTLCLRVQTGHYVEDRWIELPTNDHVTVRFEIAYPNTFVLKPVPCTHCKVVGLKPAIYRCGCKDEPTCCYCAGTGNMAGSIAFNRDGTWEFVRTPMIHVIHGGYEFAKPVAPEMWFRWPEERR